MMRALGLVIVVSAVACAKKPEVDEPREPVDLAEAVFTSLGDGPGPESQLELADFDLEVTTSGPLAKSHVALALRNASRNRVEAKVRLPVPPGAAVTAAALQVGSRMVPARFVEKKRAAEIYGQIVSRRRDPLLVAWDGPDALSLSVFPLEPGQTRRIEIDWVEPIATRDGHRWYRVPVVGHQGKLVGLPDRIRVNGSSARPVGSARDPATRWLSLGAAPLGPWEVEGYRQVVPMESPRPQPQSLVLMLETSSAMTEASRDHQVEIAHAILAAIPAQTRVTLLAVDWLVQAMAEDATIEEARQVLDRWSDIPLAGALFPQRVLVAASQIAGRVDARALVFVGVGRAAMETPSAGAWPPADAGLPLIVVVESLAASTSWPPNAETVRAGRSATSIARHVSRSLDRLGPAPPKDLGQVVAEFPTVTGMPVLIARSHGQAPLDHHLAGSFGALWVRACALRGAIGCDEIQVVSPTLSLLALESEEQYAAWGIVGENPQASLPVPNAPASRATEGLYARRARDAGFLALRSSSRAAPMPRPVREQSRAREAYAYARSRLLRENRQVLTSCLERDGAALNKTDVEVLLTVSARGEVVNVRLLGIPEESPVADCLRAMLRLWSFPLVGAGETFVRLSLDASSRSPAAIQRQNEIAQVLQLDEWDETLPLRVARIYDLPYWGSIHHLAWLVVSSHERQVVRLPNGLWARPVPNAAVVAGKLLRKSYELDAQRVVSEAAPICPALARRTFESWGLRDQAASIPLVRYPRRIDPQSRFLEECEP
jgi:hypothetical protein